MATDEKKGRTGAGTRAPEHVELSEGGECLLNVLGCHYMVKILEVTADAVRVSFPGRDYPIEGMQAVIEFHDNEGFYYYSTQVVQGPLGEGRGIVLRKPGEVKRSRHRHACRVPTDLTVQVRDRNHMRRYDAALLNISAGGALIETEAPFDFTTDIDLTLSLPGEPTYAIGCHVAHAAPACRGKDGVHRFSMRFVDLDANADYSITRYVWRCLQETHGSG